MSIEGVGYRAARKIRSLASRASLKMSGALLGEGCPHALHFKEPRRTKAELRHVSELSGFGGGRRCIILGTAPSIREIDISLAGREYVMVLNRGFELVERLGRVPDAVVMSNPYAMKDYGHQALDLGCRHNFLSGSIVHLARLSEINIFVFDQWEAPGMDAGYFQVDPRRPLYHSGSVAHAALQIAVGMGFDEIVMAGIDLQFPKDDPHFYKTKSDELKRSQTVSQDNVDRMVAGFDVACHHISERGAPRVLNAGAEGTRNPFPHKPWNEVFEC